MQDKNYQNIMFPREAYLIYNEIQSKNRAKGQVSGVSMTYTQQICCSIKLTKRSMQRHDT